MFTLSISEINLQIKNVKKKTPPEQNLRVKSRPKGIEF